MNVWHHLSLTHLTSCPDLFSSGRGSSWGAAWKLFLRQSMFSSFNCEGDPRASGHEMTRRCKAREAGEKLGRRRERHGQIGPSGHGEERRRVRSPPLPLCSLASAHSLPSPIPSSSLQASTKIPLVVRSSAYYFPATIISRVAHRTNNRIDLR
jgi:hypothetical protein